MNWDTEEIRMVVKRLLQHNSSRFIITSCGDSEGKSTLSKAIIYTLIHRFNKEVFYVDLNRRSPLIGDTDDTHFSQWGAKVKKPPLQFDTFSSYKQELIINQLTATKDDTIIIIEMSPVNVFNKHNIHPVSLASKGIPIVVIVDGYLTRRSHLLKAKAIFHENDVEFLGVVYNNFKITNTLQEKLTADYWRHHSKGRLRDFILSIIASSKIGELLSNLLTSIKRGYNG